MLGLASRPLGSGPCRTTYPILRDDVALASPSGRHSYCSTALKEPWSVCHSSHVFSLSVLPSPLQPRPSAVRISPPPTSRVSDGPSTEPSKCITRDCEDGQDGERGKGPRDVQRGTLPPQAQTVESRRSFGATPHIVRSTSPPRPCSFQIVGSRCTVGLPQSTSIVTPDRSCRLNSFLA